jgi:hypothetical protein
MSDDAKKPEHIKLVDPPPPESVFDDVEALRKVATLKVSRRVVTVNVAVKRPSNNVFFRCHPDPAWALDASVVIGDGGSDDFYFVAPNMLNHPTILPRLRRVTIATVCTWPGGAISLWPVPIIEETRIACWKSARAAFELAKRQWVQLCWNSDLRDYDVVIAEGINTEAPWQAGLQDKTFRDLLRISFTDKIVNSPEHSYVLRRRGIAE